MKDHVRPRYALGSLAMLVVLLRFIIRLPGQDRWRPSPHPLLLRHPPGVPIMEEDLVQILETLAALVAAIIACWRHHKEGGREQDRRDDRLL